MNQCVRCERDLYIIIVTLKWKKESRRNKKKKSVLLRVFEIEREFWCVGVTESLCLWLKHFAYGVCCRLIGTPV